LAISFSIYDLSTHPLNDDENIQRWVAQIIDNKGFRVGNIEYFFTSDKYILQVNREFLGHDYPTDIITFDYSTRQKLSGDILICIPVVKNNSREFGVSFLEEMLRVIIHGVLHLMGFPDYSDEEKLVMRREEDKALKLYWEFFSN